MAEWGPIRVFSAGPETVDQRQKLTLAIFRKSVPAVKLLCILVHIIPRFAAVAAAIALSFADEAGHLFVIDVQSNLAFP